MIQENAHPHVIGIAGPDWIDHTTVRDPTHEHIYGAIQKYIWEGRHLGVDWTITCRYDKYHCIFCPDDHDSAVKFEWWYNIRFPKEQYELIYQDCINGKNRIPFWLRKHDDKHKNLKFRRAEARYVSIGESMYAEFFIYCGRSTNFQLGVDYSAQEAYNEVVATINNIVTYHARITSVESDTQL